MLPKLPAHVRKLSQSLIQLIDIPVPRIRLGDRFGIHRIYPSPRRSADRHTIGRRRTLGRYSRRRTSFDSTDISGIPSHLARPNHMDRTLALRTRYRSPDQFRLTHHQLRRTSRTQNSKRFHVATPEVHSILRSKNSDIQSPPLHRAQSLHSRSFHSQSAKPFPHSPRTC